MQKLIISMRYWLLGKEYYTALKAMEFASEFYIGRKRKNGADEFSHPLSIAAHVRTFEYALEQPENAIATAFLHDIPEDFDIGFEEIDKKFNSTISSSVRVLTKKFRGNKLQNSVYYAGIAEDLNASVVKGADRIHNHQTMIDAFTIEKQKEYVAETNEFVLPMLKKARKNFPRQESVYLNEKLVLNSQIQLLERTWR